MYFFPAYFTLAMFAAALQPKALGMCICFAIGLLALYPQTDQAAMLTLLFLPAYLLASFRS
jgi:hypothetical protein